MNLRAIRRAAQLTQEELADLSGISQPTISAIETGRPTTTVTLQRLADALGCTAAELLLEAPEEDRHEVCVV